MLSWQEIIQRYIINYSNQIRKATQPLRDHFGIGYFTYHRIDEEGHYTVLVDRPEWAEYYVEEQIYLLDPFLRSPSAYEPGLCLVESHGSQEYQETVLKGGKKVLNHDTSALMIQKKDGAVEFFGVSGDKAASSLQNLYLNHPKLLYKFADYFKHELAPILCSMQHEPGYMPDLKGDGFYSSEKICPNIPADIHLDFYRDLKIDVPLENVKRLSKRERQCLKQLADDQSAKEIGAFLDLSKRTVEHYFENIKNKLNCNSKQEMALLARTLIEIGFF